MKLVVIKLMYMDLHTGFFFLQNNNMLMIKVNFFSENIQNDSLYGR